MNCQKNLTNNNNDAFVDWGLKNNLKISSYIEAIRTENQKIKFIAKTDIPKKTEILTIPYAIMFNITKALKLINLKSLNKQYNEFSKLNLTYYPNPYDFRKQETFLSYIFYLIEHKPKKYEKTKFFEVYEKYFKSLKYFSFKSPLFYEQSEIEFLGGTHLGHSIEILRNIYQNEIDILNKDSYYKKDLDYEEYVNYRFIINNKALNISNYWTLVPFLNYFDEDYTSYNSIYTIEENGDVKIRTRKKIKKGDEIVLKSKKMSNTRRLLTQGKTDERLVNYFEDYYIHLVSPGLFHLYKLNDEYVDFFKNNYINVLDKDFESKSINFYLENAERLKGDGSDTWAYDILQKNLQFYKGKFERMTLSRIYDSFYDSNDRINIERIIRGEKHAIEKGIKKISRTVNQLLNIQQTYLSGDKSKENVIDL